MWTLGLNIKSLWSKTVRNVWYSNWSQCNVKWHSDPWPTVTSQPIRLSTNFMTFIPSLTFTDYEWSPWSICNGCGMPAGNAYPSGHLVPSPHCGTCLCSNCWDQIPRTRHVFTRLFTSNTPWYFLDFALKMEMGSWCCLLTFKWVFSTVVLVSRIEICLTEW